MSANNEEFVIKPVGYVKSEIKTPTLKAREDGIELQKSLQESARESRYIRSLESELVINQEYEGILDGLEAFSHALVLYWPHLLSASGRSLIKVHPTGRKEFPLVGIFATCSPARPNPVLLTAVQIKEIIGNRMIVQGFEAVDGSPIIDIKPYTNTYCTIENPRMSDWMNQIQKAMAEV